MILVNFGNSISDIQRIQLEQLAGQPLTHTFHFRIVPDSDIPVTTQLTNLMKKLAVSPAEIEGERVVLNPPGQAIQNTMVITALFGRLGVFPMIMRTRPLMYSIPPRSEVSELVDLQELFLASQPAQSS